MPLLRGGVVGRVLLLLPAVAAVYESLDKAVATLEKKLHKYSRPMPMKKDYRK